MKNAVLFIYIYILFLSADKNLVWDFSTKKKLFIKINKNKYRFYLYIHTSICVNMSQHTKKNASGFREFLFMYTNTYHLYFYNEFTHCAFKIIQVTHEIAMQLYSLFFFYLRVSFTVCLTQSYSTFWLIARSLSFKLRVILQRYFK